MAGDDSRAMPERHTTVVSDTAVLQVCSRCAFSAPPTLRGKPEAGLCRRRTARAAYLAQDDLALPHESRAVARRQLRHEHLSGWRHWTPRRSRQPG